MLAPMKLMWSLASIEDGGAHQRQVYSAILGPKDLHVSLKNNAYGVRLGIKAPSAAIASTHPKLNMHIT